MFRARITLSTVAENKCKHIFCCPTPIFLVSGSPIIQNGKLVGAVTHVFVNDPTRGYGIFIENMLIEAEKIK